MGVVALPLGLVPLLMVRFLRAAGFAAEGDCVDDAAGVLSAVKLHLACLDLLMKASLTCLTMPY